MPKLLEKKRSEKIKDQLGMSIGMAAHKLRKLILFKFVKMVNQDLCYRCGCKIDTVEDLSVEHKEFWYNEEDALDKFFNLDNIAFSHFKCNSLNRRDKVNKDIECGRDAKYARGCRCDMCKAAHTISVRKYRLSLKNKNSDVA